MPAGKQGAPGNGRQSDIGDNEISLSVPWSGDNVGRFSRGNVGGQKGVFS
jgi:hypothetical protein